MNEKFNNVEAIFNEVEEVKFNPGNYEENSEVFQQLAIKESGFENLEKDAVFETLENIVYIGRINKNSLLYSALVQWYEKTRRNVGMNEVIRSFVEDNDNIYFVTGSGYDTIDKDLLGGNISIEGTARKEFLQWINS